ncbi:olfactory receptor 5G9-like [Pseudophryne corroboree]|uniref:olfactory receptor 5G9-like n=1 Tax=Pseudophryne corroboree TaxID=495146 RepID=UPI003081F042
MEQANNTRITYVIVKGISDVPELQVPIFLLVLLIYLTTLAFNVTILLLVCLDHRLHTPMYFFLNNLSILDICCSTISLHKVLISFISGDKSVSFFSCLMQSFVFTSFTCDELLILTAMSYDRYVAICNPLHYHVVMNYKMCSLLACVCWMLGFMDILPCLLEALSYTCYTSMEINHFFCDFLAIIKLTCNDTTALELYIIIEGVLFTTFTPLMLTIISYVYIIGTILRIQSATGRRKAFYTCSSHLTVVTLLYATLSYQYFRPSALISMGSNKLSSLFNTVVVPVLNPVIYSLKNKDVISAYKRYLSCLKTKK